MESADTGSQRPFPRKRPKVRERKEPWVTCGQLEKYYARTQWWQLVYFLRRRSAAPFTRTTNKPAEQKTWASPEAGHLVHKLSVQEPTRNKRDKGHGKQMDKGCSVEPTLPRLRHLGNTRFRPFPGCRIEALSASARETERATYGGRRRNYSVARSRPAMRRRSCGAAVVAVIIIVVAHVVVRGGGGGQESYENPTVAWTPAPFGFSRRARARALSHRPLMNSHAHVVLELPAPKEVSMIWDLNLPASFSSQPDRGESRGRGSPLRSVACPSRLLSVSTGWFDLSARRLMFLSVSCRRKTHMKELADNKVWFLWCAFIICVAVYWHLRMRSARGIPWAEPL